MGKPHGTTSSSARASLAGRRPYWTAEEDAQLVRLVKKYGTKNWGIIAKELQSPIQRKGKSCRSRWMHQLNPCIKHEPFSVEEERVLIAKQREFGNKWSKIAAFLPGRTDNAIKNHWHGHVKRRLTAHLPSSDEDDEIKEAFPTPLIRRTTPRLTHASRDAECAQILVQLSRTDTPPRTPCLTEEDESEPNNFSRNPKGCIVNKYPIGNEIIRPSQQKILSEMLASAGLAHYSILPLCPIDEEDINSEQHIVLELDDPPTTSGFMEMEMSMTDSGLDSPASYLLQSYPEEYEGIFDLMTSSSETGDGCSEQGTTTSSITQQRSKRRIGKPLRFLQKREGEPSPPCALRKV